MSAKSPDEPVTPPNLGDRLLLLVVAPVIAGFSISALRNAWGIVAAGAVECPCLQPDAALLRQVHLWIHDPAAAGGLIALLLAAFFGALCVLGKLLSAAL